MHISPEDFTAASADIVELCSGDVDGRPFHAFIKMTLEDYVRYQQDRMKNDTMDLPSYGVVLHSGWGPEPDPSVKARIMHEHGPKQ